jgi:phosphate/sulfate permease
MILACGMIASLMAAGTWLLVASYFGWPVSTTHSIVGAVVGFGVAALGVSAVAWDKVGFIAAGWVVSPLISGAAGFMLFRVILRAVFYKANPVEAARNLAPWLVFLVLCVLIGVAAFKGFKPLWKKYDIDPFDAKVLLVVASTAVVSGLIGMLITRGLVKDIRSDSDSQGIPGDPMAVGPDVPRSLTKAAMHLRRIANQTQGELSEQIDEMISKLNHIRGDVKDRVESGTNSTDLQKVEKIFVYLQILTACFVAFSHGSNDVANAIGPLSSAYQAIRSGTVVGSAEVPMWALALGGVGIIVGLATWGWRVIATVGEKITELTPSRGFCAEFAAAIVILVASILPFALPVSTTHTLVGAVLGVGLARGLGALNLSVLKSIVASWLITIPVGAAFSVIFFQILRVMFVG